MKRLIPFLLFIGFSLSGLSQLEGIIVEELTLPEGVQPAGTTTYRIYADLINPTDQLISAFAIVDCYPLEITTTTDFYNDIGFGGSTAALINPGLFGFFPTLEADSWITISGADMNAPGIQTDLIAIATDPADPYTPALNSSPGSDLLMNDGAWFTNAASPLSFPVGPESLILLGQFTTSGNLCYTLNLQIFPDGLEGNYLYVPGETCSGEELNSDFIIVEAPYLQGCAVSAACDDPNACNYDPDAEEYDSASCEYLSCAGCTDDTACNYDSEALINDGSCEYICLGCTDPIAANYDEDANEDDGSCQYGGCTDSYASNFDPEVDIADNSCEYNGCMDGGADNYNPMATVSDGSCTYDCDGPNIVVNMFDSFGDGWNSATYVIRDSENAFVTFGDLDTAQEGDGETFGYDFVCLTPGDYMIYVDGGIFEMEIITTIECLNSDPVTIEGAGNAGFTVVEGVGCIAGCTDPEADNYDPEATFEVDCVFSGCTNANAINFDPDANSDDGSCIYELNGIVFYDANTNGLFDILFDEPLAGEVLTLDPGGMVAITNENGEFSFGEVPAGEHTITHTDNPAFPLNITPNPLTVDFENLDELANIPIALSDEDAISAIGVYYSSFEGVPCNGDPEFNWLNIVNQGNQPLTGYVQFEFDPLYQGIDEMDGLQAPDSVVGNSAYYGFEDLPVGSSLFISPVLYGPDVEYIGEMVTSTAYAFAFDGEELVAYGDDTSTDEVTCAYDPNDKQAEPAGYTQEHFVLNETPIEYTIRFQNTGNAPANLVTLKDTIQTEFDIASIDVISQSHSMMTCIDPVTREVVYIFEDIQLPDSASAPEESIGFVKFRISPLPGLAPGTLLENTAHIFFDSNPAIVTNTYRHTIYECGDEANFDADTELCIEEALSATATHPYVESYSWLWDGEEAGTEESLMLTPENPGTYNLELTGVNPLCETSQNITVEVHALPDVSFSQDGAELSAVNGTAYQWYLNGEIIPGATDQTYTAAVNGDYSVEVTDTNGCSAVSDEVFIMVVGVGDQAAIQLALYPNPVVAQSLLQLPNEGPWNIQLIDANGRLVLSTANHVKNTWMLDKGSLASGKYYLRVGNNDGLNHTLEVIIK